MVTKKDWRNDSTQIQLWSSEFLWALTRAWMSACLHAHRWFKSSSLTESWWRVLLLWCKKDISLKFPYNSLQLLLLIYPGCWDLMILPSLRNFLTLESFVYFLNLIIFVFFCILMSFSIDETFISEKNRCTTGWVDKLNQNQLFFLFNDFAVQLIHLCILFAHTNYIY